jgi:serine/threonine-protein kinase
MAEPQAFGSYRLIRQIAKGGMGEVWEAYHAQRPDERVALKTLHPDEEGDRTLLTKFLDEARIGATLQHPNIVRTLDLGIEGSRLFLVMELLRGYTLAQLCPIPGEKMPLGMVVGVGLQVLAGLEHAQNAVTPNGTRLSVVHRDLKRSNLLLTDSGIVKIIDFGIAVSSTSTSTRTGSLRGSLPYLSPEQVRNEAVDGRSDLFSLGLMLHELLTGRRVFDQENEAAVLSAILWGPIPPVRSRREDVPPALEEAISWALQKPVAERPRTPRALAESLAKALPPGEVYGADQLAIWARRSRPTGHTPQLHHTATIAGAVPPSVPPARRKEAVTEVRDLSNLSDLTPTPASDRPTIVGAIPGMEEPDQQHHEHEVTRPRVQSYEREQTQVGRIPVSVRRLLQVGGAALVLGTVVGLILSYRPKGDAPQTPKVSAADAKPLAAPSPRPPPPGPTHNGEIEVGPTPVRATERPSPPAPAARANLSPAPLPSPAPTAPPRKRSATQRPLPPPQRGPGWLTIDDRSGWATIFVNGKEVGTTPLYRQSVGSGQHVIEAVRPDGSRSKKRMVRLGPGDEKKLVVDWEEKSLIDW